MLSITCSVTFIFFSVILKMAVLASASGAPTSNACSIRPGLNMLGSMFCGTFVAAMRITLTGFLENDRASSTESNSSNNCEMSFCCSFVTSLRSPNMACISSKNITHGLASLARLNILANVFSDSPISDLIRSGMLIEIKLALAAVATAFAINVLPVVKKIVNNQLMKWLRYTAINIDMCD